MHPVRLIIQVNVIGAGNIPITYTLTGISRRGAADVSMRYANLVLMQSGNFGKKKMNKAFEVWVRKRYGNRYDLTRDCDGFYCREVVKRMFDVWCHCRGLSVV